MKKTFYLSLALMAVILLNGCGQKTKIDSFRTCAKAGNPIMESYPRQCSDGESTFTEELPKPCTREYMPVCGEVDVQCIKAPCDPVKTTFPNKCEAENGKAKNITEGSCEKDRTPEEKCRSKSGKWLEESKECENIVEVECESIGGTFNPCASACRNNPEAKICTLQCVLVCEFE